MKKVLMIYPYFSTGIKKDQLFPPLGIAMLSGVLKGMGIEVMKLDCTFLDIDEAVKRAAEFDAQITGIYVMTTLSENALNILKRLRGKRPDSIYIAGGPLPTLYPQRFAEKFDYVFRGEATIAFTKFCSDYMASFEKTGFMEAMDPEEYPGIFSGSGLESEPVHLEKIEIDSCPIPDRSGFDHEKYQKVSFESTGRKSASIMMTYGCPFSCDFCSKPIFGSCVRFRSLDRVFEEIYDIISYGYDSLWIADDLFTYDMGFLKMFCKRLIREDIGISWSCLSRVDSVTGDIAALMKMAGCKKVYLGIESGSDEVLRLMNKKITPKDVISGVDTFKNSGLECSGFFIVGYPGETVQTIEKTFEFALSLGLDEISFNVPYPLPGSKLYERVSGISDEDWTFENETRFLYESEFDENWLSKRIRQTMEEFERVKMTL
ncbi:anaerobic magnesium-protoporphyrin IX monomethyl ester cyclase [Peptoclostridium litorale DSM 5388]|uniref:Putative methyltransferase n=1 Tax=Peptoclostridium litorale DSM 5388 TaxID=1121324 RepID=A0A069RHF6_PEPLI|nr:radical SAM protein [Peptoclostridium litorale]KDR96474.1 putative methyltransferase [Peptoclostridium litorale DSM 5388]SIN70170.1 anaerobic magnesium-protoporphyrin IX monomethyl ester cyclase [Peptoclostridium litorale DSM 5388]